MLALVPARRPKRAAYALLAATVFLAGCAGSGSQPAVDAGYTCAQLATDFHKRGDAPADRGQAVIDAMVAKVGQGDKASTNVRETTVYALASVCSHNASSWHPVPDALRAVKRIYQAR
jgi:hypothetical protein